MTNYFTKAFAFTVVFLTLNQIGFSQSVEISPTHPSAMLDLNSTNKGLLIPRIALTGTNDNTSIVSPVISLLIYNTCTVTGANAITPGYYSWSGTIWLRESAYGGVTGTTGWNLTGNTGTIDGTHFIGTTDNIPLNFKVNNEKAGRIDADGPVFIGYQAGNVNLDIHNSGIGYQALKQNTNGFNNTATGYKALFSNTSGYVNTANGSYTLAANTLGSYNTAIGETSLYNNTTGSYNVATGANSLFNNTTGNNNTAYGYLAGFNVATGSFNTYIGYDANSTFNTITNATAIGTNSRVDASNKVQIGNANVNYVQLGTVSNVTLETGLVKITGGVPGAGKVLTSDVAGLASWQTLPTPTQDWGITGNAGTVDGTHFIGTTNNAPLNFRVNNEKAGSISENGPVFLGFQAGYTNIESTNTGIGYKSLYLNTTGAGNTAIGMRTLSVNTTGYHNTANGYQALYLNSLGYYNTANGHSALYYNTTGNFNAVNGVNALYDNTTGSNNTANGVNAGMNLKTGNLNTFIGFNTSVAYENTTNATAIGANAYVDANNKIQLGDGLVNKVQMGVGDNVILETGLVKIKGGAAGAGKVLTSDAVGLASWETLPTPTQDWGLTGNAGTIDGTNFMGTTDNVPLNFRVNNQKAGRVAANGPVFLGYQAGNVNTGISNTGVGYQSLFQNVTGNNNTAYGYQSLYTNSIGNANTAIGNLSLYSNTDGYNNTANGYFSLGYNTSGSANTASGYYSLNRNTTGNNNTANGTNSLYNNTIGGSNTASGNNSLYANTTGDFNTAVGDGSLYYNTTGSSNTTTGFNSMRSNNGDNNTANGAYSLFSNTTGNKNTATGNEALLLNTTGSFNTANGNQTLNANTTGSNNSGFGSLALSKNTTGSSNTAYGVNSLRENFTGDNNVAIGIGTLRDNTTGNLNTATGSGALQLNTIGTRNTAFGGGTLVISTTGTDNTAIGFNALETITTGSNNLAIGSGANVPTATADNQVRIGNAGITYAGIQVAWTITSDKRWKNTIQSSKLGLDFIKKLNPVSYIRNNDSSKKLEYGFIAQELEEALNTSDASNNGIINKDDKGMLSVRYNDLLAPMVKAIQEQQLMIEAQQKQIDFLVKQPSIKTQKD